MQHLHYSIYLVSCITYFIATHIDAMSMTTIVMFFFMFQYLYWIAILESFPSGLKNLQVLKNGGIQYSFGGLSTKKSFHGTMEMIKALIMHRPLLSILAIPAISGAGLLLVLDPQSNITFIPLTSLIMAFMSAFVVGYICLKWLLNLLESGKFYFFGYYCFMIGLIVLVFF